MKILIIENQQAAINQLIFNIYKFLPGATVTSTATNFEESKEVLSSTQFDLVFCDINIQGGNCFELLRKYALGCPVIFTTTYNQFAVKAFEQHKTTYLLKPLDGKEFQRSIAKIDHCRYTKSKFDNINTMINKPSMSFKTRYIIKVGKSQVAVNMVDIAYFFSCEGTTFIQHSDGQQFVVEKTLEIIEKEVSPELFFRISRNCIASIYSIEMAEKHRSGRLQISLYPSFNDDIFISRAKVNDFLLWYEGNLH